MAGGESRVVKFKSTGRKNLRTGDKDAAMELAVLKSLAGFMNTDGGTLLVGVADDGSPPGSRRISRSRARRGTSTAGSCGSQT